MIVATPTSLFRQTFALTDPAGSGEPFGEITLGFFGGNRLTVGDAEFELDTHGLMSTRTTLMQGGTALAVARCTSLFSRRHEVVVSAEALGLDASVMVELVPGGWVGRHWLVLADGLDAGTAKWNGAIRPQLRADLSETFPLVIQAFVVAVLILQRRRERNSG